MAWESALDLLWALDREVVAAAIADVPFLAGFKNTVKSNGCTDKTLAELIVIDQGKKCIANSFKAACGESEYEPSPNQLKLVGMVGFLMHKLHLNVPAFVAGLTDRFTLHLKEWPNYSVLLYILEIKGSQVFKLGTFKINHVYNRTTILRRYVKPNGQLRKSPAFPAGITVDWRLENFIFRKVVAVNMEWNCDKSDDEGPNHQRPDFPIHVALRKLATSRFLIKTGSTEFHDRALLCDADRMLDEARVGRSFPPAVFKDACTSTDIEMTNASTSMVCSVHFKDASAQVDIPITLSKSSSRSKRKASSVGAVSLMPFLKRRQ